MPAVFLGSIHQLVHLDAGHVKKITSAWVETTTRLRALQAQAPRGVQIAPTASARMDLVAARADASHANWMYAKTDSTQLDVGALQVANVHHALPVLKASGVTGAKKM